MRHLWHRLNAEIKTASFHRFVVILAACLSAFFIFKHIVFVPAENDQEFSLALGILVASAGISLRADAFPAASRILLRFVLCLFGLYLFAAVPSIDLDQYPAAEKFLLGPGRIITFLLALTAFYRPSLGIIVLTYVLWYKGVLSEAFGFRLTVTDYMPLIEVSAFLILSQMILDLFQRNGFVSDADAGNPQNIPAGEKLFLCGVAVHMANYFYSGMMKIWIGDNPFSWVLHNKTQFLISNSAALGQLPISFSEELMGFTYDTLAFFIVPVNLILLGGQIFSLVTLLRIRWAIWTTLFYDLTHIVIFFTSGIFFYKWIILNLSIVLALETMKQRIVTPALGLMLIGMVIITPALFFVARLGWWDTPAMNAEHFSVLTKDGRIIRVPSNFFESFSVTVAQNRMISIKSPGFLNTGTYGAVMDQRNMEQAVACAMPVGKVDSENVVDLTFANDENKVSNFIRYYHAWAVRRGGKEGNWLYDLYPHHIFSSPWEFPEFLSLNLSDVTAYRYTIEAACFDMKDGKLIRKVLKEKHHDIPVAP